MKFWQKLRELLSFDAPTNTDEPFDPTIWKDKQDILQMFHWSARTLQRRREKNLIGMKKYKGKFFYNIRDVERLFANEPAKTEEPPMEWPFSPLWTIVAGLDLLFFLLTESLRLALYYMAIPLIIALPAQIIMSIQNYRNRKKD